MTSLAPSREPLYERPPLGDVIVLALIYAVLAIALAIIAYTLLQVVPAVELELLTGLAFMICGAAYEATTIRVFDDEIPPLNTAELAPETCPLAVAS